MHLSARQLGIFQAERWLFRNLNLELAPGRILAVVGPSGAGKSTLLSILAGLRPPGEGTILLKDDRGTFRPPQQVRRELGLIFQKLMLIENSDLLTNVLCGRLGIQPWYRTLLGFSKREQAEAYTFLKLLGLGAMPYRSVLQTSGGEQQRTAIARALFQGPRIFFADEPVASLDQELAHRVMQLFATEAEERQRSTVIVLHHPELVKKYAHAILTIDPELQNGWSYRENCK